MRTAATEVETGQRFCGYPRARAVFEPAERDRQVAQQFLGGVYADLKHIVLVAHRAVRERAQRVLVPDGPAVGEGIGHADRVVPQLGKQDERPEAAPVLQGEPFV